MRVLAVALLACGLAAVPAAAAEAPQESPRALLDEAADKLLQALEMMLMAVPQYAAPEINENGDIVIRRIRPKGEPKSDDAPHSPAEPGNPVQTRA